MTSSRIVVGSVLAAALTLGSVATAGAAFAAGATVTPDPSIYAIGYDNDYLYTVDIATGQGTQLPNPIGMGSVQHLGASFNPKDGTLYATNGNNNECAIWSIDTTTGIGQEVYTPTFLLPDSTPVFICLAMVFSPEGDLYLSVRSTGGINYITQIDFATGEPVYSWEAPFSSTPNFLVLSPQDGLFYMQTSWADDDMFTFDPTDLTSDAFVNVANGNNQTMYGAAFLPDGTILANSWSDLVSVDLATLGSWTVIGEIAPTDIGVLVNGTQYWPAPDPEPEAELPATGLDTTSGGLAAVGSLALVGLGLALIVRRRTA